MMTYEDNHDSRSSQVVYFLYHDCYFLCLFTIFFYLQFLLLFEPSSMQVSYELNVVLIILPVVLCLLFDIFHMTFHDSFSYKKKTKDFNNKQVIVISYHIYMEMHRSKYAFIMFSDIGNLKVRFHCRNSLLLQLYVN